MKPTKRRKMTLLELEKVKQEFLNSQELQLQWDNNTERYMAFKRAQFAGLIRISCAEAEKQKKQDQEFSPAFCAIVDERDKKFFEEKKKYQL